MPCPLPFFLLPLVGRHDAHVVIPARVPKRCDMVANNTPVGVVRERVNCRCGEEGEKIQGRKSGVIGSVSCMTINHGCAHANRLNVACVPRVGNVLPEEVGYDVVNGFERHIAIVGRVFGELRHPDVDGGAIGCYAPF